MDLKHTLINLFTAADSAAHVELYTYVTVLKYRSFADTSLRWDRFASKCTIRWPPERPLMCAS